MKTLKIKNKNYNKEKIIELEKAMRKAKSLRIYKRYSIVSKHFQGFANRAIAEMECLYAHTAGIYIKNYKRNESDGLVMNASPGCPKTLSKKQEEQLVQLIKTNTPNDVGFRGDNWIIELVKSWANNQFNVILVSNPNLLLAKTLFIFN